MKPENIFTEETQHTEENSFDQNNEKKEKITNDIKNQAALNYFLVLAPILYFNRKDSPFIQFHALQGIVLLVAFVVFWVLSDFFFLIKYLNFGVVFAAVLGFINAVQGKYYRIPLVSEVVKEGVSPAKLWAGLKRAGKISGKLFLGLFPEKTSQKISKTLQLDPDALLLERIENLEKILIIEKFFHPQTALPLEKRSLPQQDIFSGIIDAIQKNDPSATVHSEKTFVEISGFFGTILLGGISVQNPSHFSYAMNTQKLSAPKDSFTFGGFQVGTHSFESPFVNPKIS